MEIGNWKLEIEYWKLEIGNWKSNIGYYVEILCDTWMKAVIIDHDCRLMRMYALIADQDSFTQSKRDINVALKIILDHYFAIDLRALH